MPLFRVFLLISALTLGLTVLVVIVSTSRTTCISYPLRKAGLILLLLLLLLLKLLLLGCHAVVTLIKLLLLNLWWDYVQRRLLLLVHRSVIVLLLLLLPILVEVLGLWGLLSLVVVV